MKYTTFKCLAYELRQSVLDISGQKNEGRSRYVPNGRISPDVRLACAIRWFAGGSPYDIITTYGISHTDTFSSFWYVVEAVNRNPNFVISILKTMTHRGQLLKASLNKCQGLVLIVVPVRLTVY